MTQNLTKIHLVHLIIILLTIITVTLGIRFVTKPLNKNKNLIANAQSAGNGWNYINTQAGQTYTNTINNPQVYSKEGDHTPNASTQIAASGNGVFSGAPYEERFYLMTKLDTITGKTINNFDKASDRFQGGMGVASNSKYTFFTQKKIDCPNFPNESQPLNNQNMNGKPVYNSNCGVNPSDIIYGNTTNYGTQNCAFYFGNGCDSSKEIWWNGIRRVNIDGTQTPFGNGEGRYGNEVTITSVDWKNGEMWDDRDEIRNLASNETKVFILTRDNPAKNLTRKVITMDTETMTQTGSWTPPANTTKIFADKDGFVWLVAGNQVLKYNDQGVFQNVTITGLVSPSSIAMDSNKKLYVSDSLGTNQIYVYGNLTNSTPTLLEKIGVEGGIFASQGTTQPAGQFGYLRFWDIASITINNQDELFVANHTASGMTFEAYKLSDKSFKWRSQALETWGTGDFDPVTDGNDMYTNANRYGLDWTKPLSEEWSAIAQTENYNKYPKQSLSYFASPANPLQSTGNQSENCVNSYFRRIQGQRYYFCVYGSGSWVRGFRFEPNSDTMVPMMEYQLGINGGNHKLITDKNGNGLVGDVSNETENPINTSQEQPNYSSWTTFVDKNAGIWRSSGRKATNGNLIIQYFPVNGVDQYGSLQYSYDTKQEIEIPVTSCEAKRLVYDADNDSMYITSWEPCNSQLYGKAGNKMYKIKNVLSGTKAVDWLINTPFGDCDINDGGGAVIHEAGDYVFYTVVKRLRFGACSQNTSGTDWRSDRTYMLKKSDGQIINLNDPIRLNEQMLGETGFMDSVQGTRAFKRKSGEYLVTIQDTYIGRQIIYKLQPPKISGKAFLDTNGNGLIDASEQPLTGINVKLFDVNNKLKAENITDVNGNYNLYHQDESNMKIKIDPVAGQTITGKVSGGNILNSNLESDPVNHSTSGETNMMIGFGTYIPPSSSSSSTPSPSSSSSSSTTSSSSTVSSSSTTSSSLTTSSVLSLTSTSTTTSSPISSPSSTSTSTSTPSLVYEYKKLPDNFTNGTSLGGNAYSISNISGTVTGVIDLSATVTPAWNNNGIFFEFNVIDNIISNNNSANAELQDGVEIMIDSNNSKDSNYDGANDCKFSFTYSGVGNNVFNNGQGSNCSLVGANVIKTPTPDGYKMNIYIPFSSISGSGIDNQTIGWDAQVNDSDDSLTRKGALTLNNPNLGNIWNTPSTWGVAKLLPLEMNTSSSTTSSFTLPSSSSITSSSTISSTTTSNISSTFSTATNSSIDTSSSSISDDCVI